jgi:hypothetical protein
VTVCPSAGTALGVAAGVVFHCHGGKSRRRITRQLYNTSVPGASQSSAYLAPSSVSLETCHLRISGGTIVSQGWLRFDPYQTSCGSVPHKNKAIDSAIGTDAARMDGYSEWEIFWRVSFPIALPAIATTVILNFILLWNEFLYAVVLITDDANRTLPLGIQRFMGDQLEDVGMIATGLMIAIVPVIIVYAFFSEKLIQGMTAGAVK